MRTAPASPRQETRCQLADLRAQVLEVHDIAIESGPKPHVRRADTGATAEATPHADEADIPGLTAKDRPGPPPMGGVND